MADSAISQCQPHWCFLIVNDVGQYQTYKNKRNKHKREQGGGIKEMTNLHLIMTNLVGNGSLVRDPLTDIRLRNYWPRVSYLRTLIEPDRKL